MKLTRIPRPVLNTNRYKKSPITTNVLLLNLETSSFCTALKRTTDVASFTTPSPKTRLYSKGVSSWWRTYNRFQIQSLTIKSIQKELDESQPFTNCNQPAGYKLCPLMRKLFLWLNQVKIS